MSFGVLERVRKEFLRPGRTVPMVAIDEASFAFEEGELVALLGPSGCGKTTLLRIIAGLIQKTSGSVRIRGEEVDAPHPDFGFVFQTPNLMPWRNVLDNVLFPMEILRRRDAAAKARALELLEMTGLIEFEQARPHQLSGGMQQRVALCRALIHEPALLLMDEPFGALDELTRMEMNDLLLDIRARTMATVVFVTHSISEAIYLSDQVLVFSKRPARIAEHIRVDLPYPRSAPTRYVPQFTALERRASRALGVLHEPADAAH
jgi:NitT/TauT family transport system ATP-binding protein